MPPEASRQMGMDFPHSPVHLALEMLQALTPTKMLLWGKATSHHHWSLARAGVQTLPVTALCWTLLQRSHKGDSAEPCFSITMYWICDLGNWQYGPPEKKRAELCVEHPECLCVLLWMFNCKANGSVQRRENSCHQMALFPRKWTQTRRTTASPGRPASRGESWLLLISLRAERQRQGRDGALFWGRSAAPLARWLEGFCSSPLSSRQFTTEVLSPLGSRWRLLNSFSASYF